MTKQAIRERTWDTLESCGIARFPFPPHGRIPNFEGADRAADRLADLELWADTTTLKVNPDAPQRPVRQHALRAGKTLFVAVPRLREAACFLRLDPESIEDVDRATTIAGSAELGDPIHPRDLPRIDLIVCGSVAVDERGTRIGKGEGYSDLEFAILREVDAVTDATPVITTVHERQVQSERIEPDPHDVPLDVIVTPERVILPDTARNRPAGIDWSLIDEEDRAYTLSLLSESRSEIGT